MLKMKTHEKHCIVCGRKYHTTRYKNRFCSRNCQVKYQNYQYQVPTELQANGDPYLAAKIYNKVCPICGKEVTRTKRGYGCRGYKDGCKFGIFSPLCGRAIPKSAMEILLRDGRTPVLQGFVSKKSGKSF